MPAWDADRRTVPHDASAGKTGEPSANIGIQPSWSQRYDQSAVLWVQNAMAVRNKSSNLYDASLGTFAMPTKNGNTDWRIEELA